MNKDCKTKEWDIKLKSKKKPTFKASGDLTDKVNLVNVDIIEEVDEDSISTDINLEVEQSEDDRLEVSLTKKNNTRFKASGDLTEKVNKLEVTTDKDNDEASESSMLKVKLDTQENEGLELTVRKKNRFKHGTDLTEKVNRMAVDWTEETIEDKEFLTLSIKMTSSVCPIEKMEAVALQK